MAAGSRFVSWVFVFLMGAHAEAAGRVLLERLPEGWVQPRVVRSDDGSLHRVCLTGDPQASDVVYSSRAPHATDWSRPLRVNHQPGSAIAMGTIRGPDIAMGAGGRVHVMWNGSSKAQSKLPNSSPLFFARMNSGVGSFEPERVLNQGTRHLDGGGALAADRSGHVWVFWHASGQGDPDGEAFRSVFLAESADSGATFSAARPVSGSKWGACGCCGIAAHADGAGSLFALFRAASGGEDRDMILLTSHDRGATFTGRTVDTWRATQCPMSLPWLGGEGDGTGMAWETGRRVVAARVRSGTVESQWEPAGAGGRKHPVMAMDTSGRTLLVWSEGTGWQKGGAVEWQVLDAKGRPEGAVERREGLPAWSRPAAVVDAAGDFRIFY